MDFINELISGIKESNCGMKTTCKIYVRKMDYKNEVKITTIGFGFGNRPKAKFYHTLQISIGWLFRLLSFQGR